MGPARDRVVLIAMLFLAACPEPKKVKGFPDSYAGIGIELTVDKGKLVVVRTIKGGPSEAAGVKKDDQIASINGQTTEGMSLGEAVTLLRGKPNSQLTLGLQRDGKKVLVVLRRRKIKRKGKTYRAEK